MPTSTYSWRCVARRNVKRTSLMVPLVMLFLGGCASSGSGGGGIVNKALDLVGLQTKSSLPEIPAVDIQSLSNLPKSEKKVTLRIHAGDVLNTDVSGRSLSLVARIYKLKDVEPFLQAPREAFNETASGKPAPIDGAIDVREVVLTPGQKYEVVETLPPDATYLAVVALFRAPDDRRWRFAFSAKEAVKTGITIGAHGCALSVSEGRPVNAPAEILRLAGVRCH